MVNYLGVNCSEANFPCSMCVCLCVYVLVCTPVCVLVHCVDVDELSLSVDLTLPREFDSA